MLFSFLGCRISAKVVVHELLFINVSIFINDHGMSLRLSSVSLSFSGAFPQDEYPEEVSTDEDDNEMFGSRKRMKREIGIGEREEENGAS